MPAKSFEIGFILRSSGWADVPCHAIYALPWWFRIENNNTIQPQHSHFMYFISTMARSLFAFQIERIERIVRIN